MVWQDEYYTIPELLKVVQDNPVFFQFLIFFILEWIVFSYMLVLGISFIVKGIAERENKAQKAYQKGLGLFFLTAALIQVVYLAELMNRFFVGWRIWNNFYDYSFDTIMLYDYFIIYWMALLLTGAFLIYPIERYMLKRRPNISIVAAAMTPFPLLIRLGEYALGDKIQAGNVLHLVFTILWIFIDVVIVVICVFVPVLYIKMWKSSPPKSKLRRKCLEVVFGYGIYILALVVMRFSFIQIHDPQPIGTSNIILDAWFYVLVAPVMQFMALFLISSGFRREY